MTPELEALKNLRTKLDECVDLSVEAHCPQIVAELQHMLKNVDAFIDLKRRP